MTSTCNSSDLFYPSSCFTSLKHFIMLILLLPLNAKEPPMPGFAPVSLATCFQSSFHIFGQFLALSFTASLLVTTSGSQLDMGVWNRTSKSSARCFKSSTPSSKILGGLIHPTSCWGVEAGRCMLPFWKCQ